GNERFRNQHVEHEHEHDHARASNEPHESPLSMTIPLIVLALLSTFGGLVGVPYALSSLTGGHPENYFERTLAPVVGEVPETAGSTSEQPGELHRVCAARHTTDGRS